MNLNSFRGLLHSFVLGLALAYPSKVFASVVVAESLEEMTRGSSRIVRGFAANTQTQVDARTGSILTYVDFEVAETLKGEHSQTVRLRISGGTVGGVSQEVVGGARFEVGQEAVVFLEPAKDEPRTWLVRSLGAGKVDFQRSARGELRATRQLEGLSFVRKNSSAAIPPQPGDLGLAEAFLAHLRSLVSAR